MRLTRNDLANTGIIFLYTCVERMWHSETSIQRLYEVLYRATKRSIDLTQEVIDLTSPDVSQTPRGGYSSSKSPESPESAESAKARATTRRKVIDLTLPDVSQTPRGGSSSSESPGSPEVIRTYSDSDVESTSQPDAAVGATPVLESIQKCAQRAFNILCFYYPGQKSQLKATARAIATKFILAMHAHGDFTEDIRNTIIDGLYTAVSDLKKIDYIDDELKVFHHVGYKYICNDLASDTMPLDDKNVEVLISDITSLPLKEDSDGIRQVSKEAQNQQRTPRVPDQRDTKLSSGAFGTVYKLREPLNGKEVVVKVLSEAVDEKGLYDMVIREICIIQSLNHDNVVQFLHVHVKGGLIYMYMDEMVDLAKTLDKIHTTPVGSQIREFVKDCVSQLVNGLSHLHQNHIIHRDLKPENILVAEDVNGRSTYKIADMGLARYVKGDVQGGTSRLNSSVLTNRVGTLGYMAPEILLNATQYTKKVDVFSLGCIVTELCTGEFLFELEFDKEAMILTMFKTLTLNNPLFDSKFGDDKVAQKEFAQVLSLVKKMTLLNPNDRLSIEECKDDPYLLGYPP